MALIKCPECGSEISDTAEKCPQCGFAITQSTKNIKRLFNNLTKNKKGLFLIILLIVLICITFFKLFYVIIDIKDYSAITTITKISGSDYNIKINECKVYYYQPEIINVLYDNSDALKNKSVIVFCDARIPDSLGNIIDEKYVYVYDVNGNVITYFKLDDQPLENEDLFILTFLEDSQLLNWYDWTSYSNEDIGKLLNKHIENKKLLLSTASKKKSTKDIDILLEKFINMELTSQNFIQAEKHIAKLNDKTLKEKYTLSLEETYYSVGKSYYEQGDLEKALKMLNHALNCNEAKSLIEKINNEKAASHLEEQYQQAILAANNHQYKEAKIFFKKNKNYKDSQEFLELINIAEESKWAGFWVADDINISKNESHIRILATVFSYENSDIKGTTHSVTMFPNWDSLDMPYFQEHLGATWTENDNQLTEAINQKEHMRLEGDKLILIKNNGTEISFHRDSSIE